AINYLLQRLQKLTHLSLTGIPAFRRAELQQFCRPPPKEFTPNQRAAFCVYSGHGVGDLRRYLQHYMQVDGARPGATANGSDADEDFDGDIGGGFIDLGEVREQEPYPPPPYPPSPAHPPPPGSSNGYAHLRGRPRTDTAMMVHPNGTVVHAPTQPQLQTQEPQLQLNGTSTPTRGTAPSLPFPLTARTSPNSTPEPNAGTTQATQVNGSPTTPTTRRNSPGFLSFATAIARGTWIGGSSRQADATDSSPPRQAVNGSTSNAEPSTSHAVPIVNGHSPLATRSASVGSPVMRQWNPNPVTLGHGAGGSQLPSPSNSAAAFAMSGSTSQSPSNPRNPSSRDASVESLVTVRQRSSSRQDLLALEESLQDAFGGLQVASRGRERQRAAPNGSTSNPAEPAPSSSNRSNSSRQGSGNPPNYSPADGWQSRSRT
ncbi:SCF ubiquitin ligase complex subunit, partial [Tulasnella sp. 427]